MSVPDAWSRSLGDSSVIVAVIDTGDTFHSDSGARVAGYDMISDSMIANDGSGRDSNPADPGDWISTSESQSGYFSGCPSEDSSWHGTHVAGTINAASNASGIVGVAPKVSIEPIRVLGKCGGLTSDIAAAITWASGGSVSGLPANPYPADVINMSLGGSGACSSALQTAITGAVSRNTTVVVAAGNSNSNASGFNPANCSGVVVVGATDTNGRRASFSNYGSNVDVSAPGTQIYSTINAGRTIPAYDSFTFYQGTSMASPHVAGVAALMISRDPSLTPSQIESKLKTYVKAFGGSYCDVSSSAILCGSGIVNAANAVP